MDSISAKHLLEDSYMWNDMEKDVFICVEQALDSLITVTDNIQTYVNMTTLTRDADGRLRRVTIIDIDPNTIKTFVPLSTLLAGVLSMVHQVNVPKRLRLYAFVSAALPVALEEYPSMSNPVKLAPVKAPVTQSSRFAEFGRYGGMHISAVEDFHFMHQIPVHV